MEGQLTLKELNLFIKEALELSFQDEIWVVAEIGELKINRSGHCYLELIEKDEESDKVVARARATIWSWQFRFIKPYFETTCNQPLTAGIKVMVAASVEFHELYGLSLNIKDIDPTYTIGDLARKKEEIVKRLKEEGVFDMNKELTLPDLPSKIAVISSANAAGYEDFMNQLHNNEAGYVFYTKLFEASMQGDGAVPSIIHALDHIYQMAAFFEAVVIIRGGGAQTDLLCFDNYELAINIAQFPLPVITGIGHEKDESVADLVANTKLKTPTAVAEFLINRYNIAEEELSTLNYRLNDLLSHLFKKEENRLGAALRLFKPLVKAKFNKSEYQLIQMARDLRPLSKELIERQKFQIMELKGKTLQVQKNYIREQMHYLSGFADKTAQAGSFIFQQQNARLTDINDKIVQHSRLRIADEFKRLEWLDKNKNLIDPDKILKRGYSIVTKNGKVLKNRKDVNIGDHIETRLYKGKLEATVNKIEENDD